MGTKKHTEREKTMIIVLGSVAIKEGHVEEALTISQRHVDHSRTEPGCIEHGVHVDHENPLRLVFVEKWENYDSLKQHFAEPTSIAFVNAITELVTQAPQIDIYEASKLN